MEQERNILDNLPPFSQKGTEVYQALLGVHSGDDRIQIFARRAARAITAFDAGTYGQSQGPLERFLLCGTTFSSIPLLVRTLAGTWIGEPWDKSPPFLYVDCGAFQVPFPGILAPLIGSSASESEIRQAPLFARLEWPHLKARQCAQLRALHEWQEWFFKQWREKIDRLGNYIPLFYREFSALAGAEGQRIRDEECKAGGPFASVIFFDAVDRASQMLRELLLQILHSGTITLATGAVADFSNSIIIASMYCDDQALQKADHMGFERGSTVQDEKPDPLTESYNRLRKRFLNEAGSGVFVQGVGENFILIRERTRESQRLRIVLELQRISHLFAERGLTLKFTDRFISSFVDDTKETIRFGKPNGEIFTEERVVNGMKRYIFDALHRLVLFSGLHGGTILRFECENEKDFRAAVILEHDGNGERIQPEHMRVKIKSTMEHRESWPEWLKKLDKEAGKLLSSNRMM